jgi:rRNA maturation endonuclease Nob1
MKRLLEQQEEIIDNYSLTKGATEDDLRIAINQHAMVVGMNGVLRPIEWDVRPLCSDTDGCVSCTVEFDTIDGSFCAKCGQVYPF